MRRGGRGAASHAVATTTLGSVDVHARRGHGRTAGVAGGGERVVLVAGGDADHVGHAGGVGDGAGAVVAGGGDEDGALAPGVAERLGQSGRVGRAAEAHQDDVGAVVGGPEHAGHHVAVPAGAGLVED